MLFPRKSTRSSSKLTFLTFKSSGYTALYGSQRPPLGVVKAHIDTSMDLFECELAQNKQKSARRKGGGYFGRGRVHARYEKWWSGSSKQNVPGDREDREREKKEQEGEEAFYAFQKAEKRRKALLDLKNQTNIV
ncbi:hypothetical protein BDN67DRAFT_982442 [Paxillus ammoniavirescens]|nr:hypothetical protein BDN67DRAFT_982442 [Paxillus ammoniavirescens]